MQWDKVIGPATVVYLVSLTIGGVWWASDLSARLSASESAINKASASAERIARLETLLTHLDSQLNRIEDKLDRRNPP